MAGPQGYTYCNTEFNSVYGYGTDYNAVYSPQQQAVKAEELPQQFDYSAYSSAQQYEPKYQEYNPTQFAQFTPLERSYSDQSIESIDSAIFSQDMNSTPLQRSLSDQSAALSLDSMDFASDMLDTQVSRSWSTEAVYSPSYHQCTRGELRRSQSDHYPTSTLDYTEYDATMSFVQKPTTATATASGNFDFSNLPTEPGHAIRSCTTNTIDCQCGAHFEGKKPKNVKSNYKRHLLFLYTEHICEHCLKSFKRPDNCKKHMETCRSRLPSRR